jgi:hypothetical protein
MQFERPEFESRTRSAVQTETADYDSLVGMSAGDSLPDDVITLKAMLRAERAARSATEADARARILLIEKLKLTIRKLRHEQFGQSSERGALLDQLELQLADLEENAASRDCGADRCSPTRSRCHRSSAASRCAGRCRSICRGSALS